MELFHWNELEQLYWCFHNSSRSLKCYVVNDLIIILTSWDFLHQCKLMVVHWSLSGNKFPHIFRTLLGILTDISNAVVLRVSIRPLISNSSCPFTSHLVIVLREPITIGITVNFRSLIFFNFPSKIEVLILLFAFFQFYSVVNRDSKVHNLASSLFCCWLL